MPDRVGDREPLADALVDPEIVSSELVFEGMVWRIRREVFAHDDATITREFVAHTGAIVVLALDDDDRALLIQQYRHPIRAREWELPAGLLDLAGESPLDAAKRELAEEADLEATEWSVLIDFVTSPGGSDEHIRVFLARGLTATQSAFARTEEEADIVTRWEPLEAVVSAVLERRIQNSILQIAVLAASESRSMGWRSLAPADAPWPRHPANRATSR